MVSGRAWRSCGSGAGGSACLTGSFPDQKGVGREVGRTVLRNSVRCAVVDAEEPDIDRSRASMQLELSRV